MPENLSSIRGEITLDPSNYKKGIEAAKQATQGLNQLLADAQARFKAFGGEEARATIDCMAFTAAEKETADQVKRTGDSLKQETAFIRDLTTAQSRLTAIREGESRIAQEVIARYNLLTGAEQRELIAAREAQAVHDAKAKALVLAAAAEQQAIEEAARTEARAIQQVAAEAERLPAKIRQASRDMVNAGRALTIGLTGPIVAAGTAVLKAGVDVDKGMDAVRLATGATGQQLQTLQSDFKAVGASVPQSLAEVGQALGAVAARTGLTGPPLQGLTARLLTLSRLMGQDLQQTITTTTRLFGDWGVATRDQARTLDLLARAHQASNISLGELTRQLVQFGAPLRTVGFTLDQSVALFAKWHKEGVNAAQIATSIRIAISRMVNAGVKDVPAAFQQAIRAIQAAKTPADQLALSFKLFGAKAGTDMARAIREGRFAIGALVKTLEQGKGTILETAKQTDDFKEKFGHLRNAVELALDPLGAKLMGALTNLAGALQQQVPRLKDTVGWFLKLSPSTQEATAAVGLFVAGLGPALFVLGKLGQAFLGIRAGWGIVVTGATSATNALSSFVVGINAAQVAATARFGLIGAAVVAAGAFFVAFANNFDGWRDRFNSGLANIADNFAHVWDNLQTVAGRAWQNISQNGFDAIRQLGQNFLRGSVEVADTMSLGWQRLWSIVTGKGDPLDRWLADKEKRIRELAQAQNFVPVATGMMPGNVPRAGFGALREIEENRARTEAGLATRPPPLPGMSPTALGGGVNPPDWMNNLGKKAKNAADEAEKEAKRIQRIFAQTRRSALGAGREKGDFATAEQQAALKLYAKDFDDLSAAQKRVADQLARIVVGGERAAAAQAAHRKELQAHTRTTNEALAAARKLHAETLDMQRQINQPAPAAHAAAAAARYLLASPEAQRIEREAQAEHDRMAARLKEVLKSRREIEAVDRQIAAIEAKRPDLRTAIGPPIPPAFIADQGQLDKRLTADRARLAQMQRQVRSDSAATQAILGQEAGGWKVLGEVTNDIITRRKELLGITATEATAEARLAKSIDFTNLSMVEAAYQALQANKANDALAAAQERENKGWGAISDAMAKVTARREELAGATRAAVSMEQSLASQIDFADLAMVEWAADALRANKAADELAASQKAAAKATAESQRIDELLTNTMTDLNAEFATLTGQQPEQTRAINRLQKDWKSLTVEQQLQLKQIQGMFRRRELLGQAKEFADGMGSILGNALEGLQNGFKGFFSGIYQGFKQLLVRMAAEYLASQFQRVVLQGLSSLIGAAFGGGGGSTQMSGGGGVDVGGGAGFQTAGLGGPVFAGAGVGSGSPILPQSSAAGRGEGPAHITNVTMHVHGVQDAASFQKNEGAILGRLGAAVERRRRRDGR